MNGAITNEKRKKPFLTGERIFLIAMLVFPVVQFAVFYFGVNINSLLLSMQKFVGDEKIFVGFENYSKVFQDLFKNGTLAVQIKNSAILYGVGFITLPLHIFVAYCVWKKLPFSSVFKVILFLPNVISSIVFVSIAKYLIDWGLPTLIGNPGMPSLLDSNTSRGFITVVIFGAWLGFASGMVIYLSSMSSISTDVVEYTKLDPVNFFQEFIYIVIPSIFPTITTFIVMGVAGFFTNYGHLFSFYGGGSTTNQIETLGYRFFVVLAKSPDNSMYPYCSAAGLMFSIVACPLTLLIKWVMEKYGPSED